MKFLPGRLTRRASVLAALAGCGGTSASNLPHDGGAPDATKKDSARDAGSFSDIVFGDSIGSGPKLGCSADLHDVVNAKGALVTTCPPDEGCAGGACVPACEAAAASQGTLGCDFVIATPSYYWQWVPGCFTVVIANGWSQPAAIQVSRLGESFGPPAYFGLIPVLWTTHQYDWPHVPTSGVPAGGVGIFFMSGAGSCGGPVATPTGTLTSTSVYTGYAAATGMGDAFHIVTSLPVTAYDLVGWNDESYGRHSFVSYELLIPTTAWSTNYYGIVPPRGAAKGSQGPQWGQIVAMEDGTTVDVVPDVTLPGGAGVAKAPASAVTTFSLNAGQFIQWQDSHDMSNTVISSNHPVGFTGGSTFGCYSSLTSASGVGVGYCESVHQQIPPIRALGHEYVAPPYTTRMASLAPESIPYRLVGVVDGTTLTFDPAGIAGAPVKVKAGEVVDFESTLAFHVTSQDANHPFYVAQMMTSGSVTGGARPGCGPGVGGLCSLGDSQFVNILPPAQFLHKYVFFADVTFPTTNLVFTRVKGPSGFEDVTLDCAGVLTGWQAVGTAGQYEVTNIDLIRAAVPNGKCNNGARTATSAGAFGLMVWGLDDWASYGYPAGGNASAINTVVVPAMPK